MRKLLLAFLLAAPAWSAIGTPILLDLTDRSTVARTGNVILAGIPLAESYAVTDVQNIAITTAPAGACAGGANIDSHRLVTERWHGDPTDVTKNIKWVLVAISSPTLAGSGVAHVCLADRSGADPGTATTVTVNSSDTCPDATACTTVNTGVNKYWIRHDSFNLFDQVKNSGGTVTYVSHSTSGGIVAVTSAGTFTSATVPTATPGIPAYSITTEEPTGAAANANEAGASLYAAIKVSGALWNGTTPKFTYVGELFFFGGMGEFKFRYTWFGTEDMFSTANQPTEIGLHIPTSLSTTNTALFGTDYGTPSASKSVSLVNQTAYLSQYDHGNTVTSTLGNTFNGTAVTSAGWYLCNDQNFSNLASQANCATLNLQGYRVVLGTSTVTGGEGNQSDGWCSVDDATSEVNIWMRDNWQSYPMECEVSGAAIALYRWPKHGDTHVDGRSTGDLTAEVGYKHDMSEAGIPGFSHYWPFQGGAALNMTPESPNPIRAIPTLVDSASGHPVTFASAAIQATLNDTPCNVGTGPSSCAFWPAATTVGGVVQFDSTKARRVFFKGFTGGWASLNGFFLAEYTGSQTGGTNFAIFNLNGTPVDASGFGAIPAGCLGNPGACLVGMTSTMGHAQTDGFGLSSEIWGNFTPHGSAAAGNDAARWRDTLLFTNPTYFCDTSLVFGHLHAQDNANFRRPEAEETAALNNLWKKTVVQNVFGIWWGFQLYGGAPGLTGNRYWAADGRRHWDIGAMLHYFRTGDPFWYHLSVAEIQATEAEFQHQDTSNPITGSLGTYTCTGTACGVDHTGTATTNVAYDTKHYTDTNSNLVVKHNGSGRCTESEGNNVWFPIFNAETATISGGGANVNPCSDGQQPWLDYPTTVLRFDYNLTGYNRDKVLIQDIANNVVFSASRGTNIRTLNNLDTTSTIYNGLSYGRAFGGCMQVATDALEILGSTGNPYLSLADGCFADKIQDTDANGIINLTQNPGGQIYESGGNGPNSATPSAAATMDYAGDYFVASWYDWSFAEYVNYKGNVPVAAPSYSSQAAVNVQTALSNVARFRRGQFDVTNKIGGLYMAYMGGRPIADDYAISPDAEKLKYINRLLDYSNIGIDNQAIGTGCAQTGSASQTGDTPSTPPTAICYSPGSTAGPPNNNLTNLPNPNAMSVNTPDVHSLGPWVTSNGYLEYSLVGQSPAWPDFPPNFVTIPLAGVSNSPLTFITPNNSGGSWTFDFLFRAGSTCSTEFCNLGAATAASGDVSVTVINPDGTTKTGVTATDSAGDTYSGNTVVFKIPTQKWPPAAGGGPGGYHNSSGTFIACGTAPAPPSINYTAPGGVPDGLNNKDNRLLHFSVPAGATGEYKIQITAALCTGGTCTPSDAFGANIHSVSPMAISTGSISLVACAGNCSAANQFQKADLRSVWWANVPNGVTKFQADSNFHFQVLGPSDTLYRGSTSKTLALVSGGYGLTQLADACQASYPLYVGGIGGVKPLLSPSPQVFYDSANFSNQTFTSVPNNPVTLTFSGCNITGSAHNGTTNSAYSPTTTYGNSGCGAGTPSYGFTGNLPPGLSIVGSTGVMSGTPTLHGTYNFSVTETGQGTPSPLPQTVIINDPVLCTINSGQNPLSSGNQNQLYSYTIATSNCASPQTWSTPVGSLPTGLTIDNTGKISGTPTGSGTSSFTARVVDNAGTQVDLATSINIVASAPCVIANTSPLANGAQTVAYGPVTLTANNCGTVTGSGWVVTVGSLPTGLTLHSTTGVIDGTPSGTGTSTFTVQFNETGATNPTKQFQISITAAPNINPSTVKNGSVNDSYSVQLSAVGGTAPYTWSVISGTLPTGLTLGASTGLISGTPTVAGTYTFQVQVQDTNSATGSVTYSNVIIFPAGGSHHSGTHNVPSR